MKFTNPTSILTFGLFTLISSALATPVHLDSRDVFVPPVTSPKLGDTWKVGDHQDVTWDISNRPVNITNKIGRIMLRKGDLTTPIILADKFDILLGKIGVTVPWVENGDDYQVVLFGDSGNFSPEFNITS